MRRTSLTTALPLRPRLVLRVAFAGNQKLPEDATFSLRAVLVKAFETIGYQLAAIAPGVPVRAGQEPGVAAFYARQCPRLAKNRRDASYRVQSAVLLRHGDLLDGSRSPAGLPSPTDGPSQDHRRWRK